MTDEEYATMVTRVRIVVHTRFMVEPLMQYMRKTTQVYPDPTTLGEQMVKALRMDEHVLENLHALSQHYEVLPDDTCHPFVKNKIKEIGEYIHTALHPMMLYHRNFLFMDFFDWYRGNIVLQGNIFPDEPSPELDIYYGNHYSSKLQSDFYSLMWSNYEKPTARHPWSGRFEDWFPA